MNTLLITGSSGFLGNRLVQELSERWQLLTPGHTELDITDSKATEQYLREHRPCAVLHTAALSNTGYCQQHPEESFAVNVLGAENLAKAAQKIGAKLVFCSSDQVYNGNLQPGPHKEDEILAPANVYGCHKLEAEQRVLAACPQAVCLRLSWMYDLPREGCRNNLGIVGALCRAAMQGETLKQNPLELRGITWVMTLVRQTEALLKLPGGVYNAGAENLQNSWETVRALARQMGIPEDRVVPADWPGRNLSMDCRKLKNGGVDLGDTQGGFEAFLAAYSL